MPYHPPPPQPNQRQPVAFIHQDLGLIEWMTVGENVGLAQGYSLRGRLRAGGARGRRPAEALRLAGGAFAPPPGVQGLPRAGRSFVAMARALAVEAEVRVPDDPPAGWPADEVEKLFAAIRPLKERGVAMIYVSHRLDEIFRIADRVAVLRDGQLVGQKPVAETTPDELIRMIVGRKADQLFVKAEKSPGPAIVSVNELSCRGAGPVSFDIRQGELLGLVGLRGAGQELIGRALFGCEPSQGSVRLNGTMPDLSSTVAAMASGIGLIARDRTEESVAMSLSLRENTFLNPGASGRSLFSFLSPRREAEAAYSLGSRVGLRPNDQSLAIEALSGGNQQKVVVGRWLATGRKLLIAEDPTAGVDVGAKADIYRLIAEAVKAGLAVLVVSTDFEEIAHICHRALVFSRGRIVRELSGADLTTPAVIAAASASEAA